VEVRHVLEVPSSRDQLLRDLLASAQRFERIRSGVRSAVTDTRLPAAFHAYSELDERWLFTATMLSLHREVELCGDQSEEFSVTAAEVIDLLERRFRFKPDVPLAKGLEPVVLRGMPEPLALRLAGLTGNAGERIHVIQSASSSNDSSDSSIIDEMPRNDGGGAAVVREIQVLRKQENPEALPKLIARWEALFWEASLFDHDYDVWCEVQVFAIRMTLMVGHWISFREGLRMLEMVEPSRRDDCLINLCGNEIHRLGDLNALRDVIVERCSQDSRLEAYAFLQKIVDLFGVIGTAKGWNTGIALIREVIGSLDDASAMSLVEAMLRERILSLALRGDWGEAERVVEGFGSLSRRRSTLLSMALIAAAEGESERCTAYLARLAAYGEPPRKWRFSNLHRAISFLRGDTSARVESILDGFGVIYPEVRFGDDDGLGLNIQLAACLIGRVMISREDAAGYCRIMDLLYVPTCPFRLSWFFGEFEAELGRRPRESAGCAMRKWHEVLPWDRPNRYWQNVQNRKQNLPVEKLLRMVEARPDLTDWMMHTVGHGVQVMVSKGRGESVGRLLGICGDVNFFGRVVLIGAVQRALESLGCEDVRVAKLMEDERISEAVSEIELHVGRHTSDDELEELKRASVDEALAMMYEPIVGARIQIVMEKAMRSGVMANQEKVFRFLERAFFRELHQSGPSIVDDSLEWAHALQYIEDASVRMGFVERMMGWYEGVKNPALLERVGCFYGVEVAAMGDIPRGMKLVAGAEQLKVRCSGLARMAARLLVEREDTSVFDIFASGLRQRLETGHDCSAYAQAMVEFGEVCLRFRHREGAGRLLRLATDTAEVFDGSEGSLARLFAVAHAFEIEDAWVTLLRELAKKPNVSLSSLGYWLADRQLPLTHVSDDVRAEAATAMLSASRNGDHQSMGQILWFVLIGASRPDALVSILEDRFPVLSTGIEKFLELSERSDFPFEVLSSLAGYSERGLLVLHQVLLRKWMHECSMDELFRELREACESFSNDDM
jgi:hypothetical protein